MREMLASLRTMKNGDVCTIDLKCGSTLTIQRVMYEYMVSANGFRVLVKDKLHFANAHSTWGTTDPTELTIEDGLHKYNQVSLWIGDRALPTLRAVLTALTHNTVE